MKPKTKLAIKKRPQGYSTLQRLRLDLELSGKNGKNLVLEEKEERSTLRFAFGSPDNRFIATQLTYLIETVKIGDNKSDMLNNALALLNGLGPNDEMQGMLALQMVVSNHVSMRMNRILTKKGLSFEAASHYAKRAHKAQSLFLKQLELFNRLKTGGQTIQKVVVERVEVKDGGKAIVGAVTGGREKSEKDGI